MSFNVIYSTVYTFVFVYLPNFFLNICYIETFHRYTVCVCIFVFFSLHVPVPPVKEGSGFLAHSGL